MRELTPQERIDIVRYRMENAKKTLSEVEVHIENGFYNTAVNRMYYACYYAVCALLISNKIQTKSHDGARRMFNLHFVKNGIVTRESGSFFSDLSQERTTGDYDDLFDHNLASCEEYYPKAKDFVAMIEQLVEVWFKDQKGIDSVLE